MTRAHERHERIHQQPWLRKSRTRAFGVFPLEMNVLTRAVRYCVQLARMFHGLRFSRDVSRGRIHKLEGQ